MDTISLLKKIPIHSFKYFPTRYNFFFLWESKNTLIPDYIPASFKAVFVALPKRRVHNGQSKA